MIIAAAVKILSMKTGEEVVLCGLRHGNPFEQIKGLGLTKADFKELCQGFIDHEGKFLDREEALEHAISCGQLSWEVRNLKKDFAHPSLFSEDLW